jgi:hypothetical protein
MNVRDLVKSALRARVLNVYRNAERAPAGLTYYWKDHRSYLLLGDDRALAELAAELGPSPSRFVLI